jgi:hypothetical protein
MLGKVGFGCIGDAEASADAPSTLAGH